MKARTISHPTDYAAAVAEIVAQMPTEQAAQVYDFARFLESQKSSLPAADASVDDWLADDEGQLELEDVLWEAAQAAHQDKFAALAEAARSEISDGTTQPLFNEQGEVTLE